MLNDPNMIPAHVLIRKIQIESGLRIEKQAIVQSIPSALRRWLLKTANDSPGNIQLYFLIVSEGHSFLVTAVYFGKHFEIALQKEDSISAPFASVKRVYLQVVDAIQDHITALAEAEKAIEAINRNQK